jgi:nitrite reductase/ring-hydroxylating ferredoxin subunit
MIELTDVVAVPEPVRALTPRVHAAVLAGQGDLAPTTMRIPNERYTDPAIAAAELRTSFTAPLLVVPSGAIPNAGDYVTMNLIDTPIVATRDDSGRAHVFVNACRHRGARVAEGTGCVHRFTCPYHNWVYAPDGSLVGIPRREGFSDIDVTDHGLRELPSEERHGFLWAQRDPDSSIDLETHLGPLGAELDAWGFEYSVAAVMTLELRSNWKCALEAFQETYHFPYVHANSIVGQGTIADIAVFDQLGRHHRLGVPLASIAGSDTPPDGENLSCIYYIHPCVAMATSPLGGELLQFFPGPTPTTCTVRHTILSRQSLDDDVVAAFFADYVPLIQAVIRDEDAAVLESSGIGLAAGHTDAILGRNEIACQASHRQLEADLLRDNQDT